MSRQINLYDPGLRKQRDWLSSRNVLLASLLAVLVISLGATAARWHVAVRAEQARSTNVQLLAARQAFAEFTRVLSAQKEDPQLVAALRVKQAELQAARQALDALRGMSADASSVRPGAAETLHALSRQHLDGLWLTGLTIGAGGGDLEIRGRMTRQALLPEYLRRLEREPVFQGRRFAALDMQGGPWRAESGNAIAVVENAPEPPWTVAFVLSTRTGVRALPGGEAR
jgi:hypothetical protein